MEQRDHGPVPGEGAVPEFGAGGVESSVPDGEGADDGSSEGSEPGPAPEENPDLAATVVRDASAAKQSDSGSDLDQTVVHDTSAAKQSDSALDRTVVHDTTRPRVAAPELDQTAVHDTSQAPEPDPGLDVTTIAHEPFEGRRPHYTPSMPTRPPVTRQVSDPDVISSFRRPEPSPPRERAEPPRNGTEPSRDPGASRRGPKRWVLVTAAALTVAAVASTAAAIAANSKPASPQALPSQTSTAVAGTTTSDATTATPTATSSPVVSDTGTTSSAPTTTTGTTTKATTTTTTSSPPPSTKTTPTPPATTTSSAGGGSETDCESVSHDTPADTAMKFSGMTKGTQAAFLAAQKDAQKAGLTFTLNSGYRSAAYQQRIFDCYVKQLGSAQAARKYALPPSESAHVKGYAMDIAPQNAAAWLEATAGKYGLCRRYGDEPWHFEYQSSYKNGCPALVPQP